MGLPTTWASTTIVTEMVGPLERLAVGVGASADALRTRNAVSGLDARIGMTESVNPAKPADSIHASADVWVPDTCDVRM